MTRQRKTLADAPAFQRLVKLLDDPRNEVLWYHKVGEQIEQLLPSDDRQHGSSQMEALHVALKARRSKNLLWDYRAFHRQFSRREVTNYMALAARRKFSLTWSHITYVKSIDDKAVRNATLKQCIERHWSSDELYRRIKPPPSNRRRTGKAFRPPQELKALLLQMNEECELWLRRWREAWFNSASPLRKLKTAPKSREQRSRLERVVLALEGISSQIDQELPGLQRMKRAAEKRPGSKARVGKTQKK